MDLASVFSEMVGAETRLWFHVELRKHNRVHTWYLSHFLIMKEHHLRARLTLGFIKLSCFMKIVAHYYLKTFMGLFFLKKLI